MRVGRLSHLNRFPVKSMQGERLKDTVLSGAGIEGDRIYALRDLQTGKIASAKKPQLWRTLLDCRATTNGDVVTITLPDGTEVTSEEPAVDDVLSRFVGRAVRLERAVAGEQGAYASEWPVIDGLSLAGDHDFPVALGTHAASFVDVASLHFVTTSTLQHLQDLAPDSRIDERRFRPSFVVEASGVDGFAENDWMGRTMRIGDAVELLLGMPTPRCVMTTVEQPGLLRDKAVLRTIAEHNRQEFEGVGSFACAGIYAEVTVPGRVAAGDPVELDPA